MLIIEYTLRAYKQWLLMRKENLTKVSGVTFFYIKAKRSFMKIILKSKQNDFFSSTNIETYGYCNKKCDFCFNSKDRPNRDVGIMNENLWHKIIDELASIKFTGRISLHFYGEPLLDKRLHSLIKYARDKCPYALIQFNSNGLLLTEKSLKKLIKAGVDNIRITDYEKPQQEKLKVLSKKYHYWINLRTVDEFEKENRAGMIFEKQNENADKPCLRPSYQLVINWKGEVLLCCNDFYAKHCFGNVTNEKIIDIWNKDEFANIRISLQKPNSRKKIDFCKNCDMM